MALRTLCFVGLLLAASASRLQHKNRLHRNQLAARALLKSDPIGSPEDYESARPINDGSELAPGEFPYTLIVKFMDEAKVRAHGASPATSDSDDQACLSEIEQVKEELGVELDVVFDEDDPELDELVKNAEDASHTVQPDMHGIVEVKLSANDGEHIVDAAKRFDALACVEYVSIEMSAPPPPMRAESQRPCHSSTPSGGKIPSFTDQQGYKRSDQLDADYLHNLGANGAGIRYSDCEYSFNPTHQEFVGANIKPHFPIDPASQHKDHGTASLGITLGKTGFGVKGLANQAEPHFYSEYPKGMGYNRARAVKAAIAGSRAGDVVLMEMQSGNPYAPAETSATIWNLVKMGSDKGVVIVAAAGNGKANLDSASYAQYRARGDSGAIIVGAGDKYHRKASFSTYGKRVDVQAWGDWSVMTAGYGKCTGFTGSSDPNKQYTNTYAGTSSASAIVAGAVTLFQSWALKELGAPMQPKQLRELLKSTGRAQGGDTSKNIGVHINLRAAAEKARQTRRPNPSPSPSPSPSPTPGCSDQEEHCGHWAGLGYCDSSSQYHSYMERNCCQTCSCRDKNDNCASWTSSGYCQASSQYYGYMQDNCCASCKR